MEKQLTAFIGLSHLGLVTSICWASLKQPVLGIDTDNRVIGSLKKGKLLIMEDGVILNEPGLPELFKTVKRTYHPTTDFTQVKNCRLVFFVKDTPKNTKNPEKEIFNLIKRATPYFEENTIITIMSQVPVGFCRMVQNFISQNRPKLNFTLYHWVDTIVMTIAIERFLNPERIIIGSNNTTDKVHPLLKNTLKLFDCPVFYMSFESAELTKAAINFYLANSITFANTLSDFCEVTGANINEIIPALRLDKRIGQYAYIQPNLRIAGGHLERDLYMLDNLAKRKSIASGSVGFIIKQNNQRYAWAIHQIKNHVKKKNPTVCIWGLSYKKDTTSTKNAASLEIIKALKNNAKIKVYDPIAIIPKTLKGYIRYNSKYQALKNSDCLLILTDWLEFGKVNIVALNRLLKNKVLIDCVGSLTNKCYGLKHVTYVAMGSGNSNSS